MSMRTRTFSAIQPTGHVHLGNYLNQTMEHSYTQAASCESTAGELSAVLRASTAAVTSGA
jgi:tryptophanyl-tRNA synthetase